MKRFLLPALAACAVATAAVAQTSDFADAMAQAMTRMHHDMAAASTGDADRDFATMMIAHHRGAIEMAEAELRFGKDERLRRLAQGIIVEQQQEIAVMQAIVTKEGGAVDPAHRNQGHHR